MYRLPTQKCLENADIQLLFLTLSTHTYVLIYMNTCTYMHEINMFTHVHVYIVTYIYMYVHTSTVHTCMHTYVHTCITYVTGFVKRGLPHTSSFLTLKDHNLVFK